MGARIGQWGEATQPGPFHNDAADRLGETRSAWFEWQGAETGWAESRMKSSMAGAQNPRTNPAQIFTLRTTPHTGRFGHNPAQDFLLMIATRCHNTLVIIG